MSKHIYLVSGANKGIGKQIALELVEQGHTVYLGARDLEAGKKAAQELKERGDAWLVYLNLNDAKSHQAAVELIEQQSGHLDGLINNAGVIVGYGNASNVTHQALRETFETNVFGTIMLTQTMLPLLRKGSHRSIVNVSTGLGSMTMHGDPSWPFHGTTPLAYNASKSALNMFTVLLAKELRDEGFRVNSVSPGWIATDLGGEQAPGSVEEGAVIAVKTALEGSDGPTGLFLTTGGVIPW